MATKIGLTDVRRTVYRRYLDLVNAAVLKDPTVGLGLFTGPDGGNPNARHLLLESDRPEEPPEDPWSGIVINQGRTFRITLGRNPLQRTEGLAHFQFYHPVAGQINIASRVEAAAEQIIDGVMGVAGFSSLRLDARYAGTTQPADPGVMYFDVPQPVEHPATSKYVLYTVECPFWYEQRAE